jgi:hypothetical protein
MSSNFYSNLTYLTDFKNIADFDQYITLPNDWLAVLTDVKGSTAAVKEGKYKDVNFVGAAVIIALQNLAVDHNLPYIFGGDGATLFIPKELEIPVRKSLSNTQSIAKETFNLKLRCMIYPISKLTQQGLEIKIAKLKLSNLYTQAMVTGDGMDYLENVLKDSDSQFHILPKNDSIPDFAGLTCRWQDIPSRHGEIVTLIVKVQKIQNQTTIYQEVLDCIAKVYGNSDDFNPISKDDIKLNINFNQLNREAKLFNSDKGWIKQIASQVRIWIVNLFGHFTESKNLMVQQKKNNILIASDFKKFENALKMVIAGNHDQRMMLVELLDQLEENKLIWYGYNISEYATMTCLVYAEGKNEVHFIDGAGGGYTKAAKMLKEKIKLN